MRDLANQIHPSEETITLRVVIGLLTVAFVALGVRGWYLIQNDGALVRFGAMVIFVSLALGFALLGNIAGAIRSKS